MNHDYQATLKNANTYNKKPTKVIEMIFNGTVAVRNMPSSGGAYELHNVFNTNLSRHEKEIFRNFIISIAKKNVDVLESGEAIKALRNIYLKKDSFVNKIETWKKNTYNLERQIKSIARHLFCVYPIPKFMDNIWLNDPSEWHINLFIHLGKGWSPRKFADLPVPLSKKESIHFLLAPENYTPIEAIVWAKVFAHGGDERLVRPMMESRIVRNLENKTWEFWETVLKFFVEQPLLDINNIAPICDYINYVKFESRTQPRPGGGWITIKPENPDFKVNGRTVQALVRGMERWHKEMGSSKTKINFKNWEGFKIDNYEVSYGKDEKRKTYSFTQLLSETSLKTEGRTHGHCVAGYANTCATGRTSIWSMVVSDNIGLCKNLLTIEVSPQKTIVQCRGKLNRLADSHEWMVVQQFAGSRNLEISKWVGHQ